jgi:hypothetical protein
MTLFKITIPTAFVKYLSPAEVSYPWLSVVDQAKSRPKVVFRVSVVTETSLTTHLVTGEVIVTRKGEVVRLVFFCEEGELAALGSHFSNLVK